MALESFEVVHIQATDKDHPGIFLCLIFVGKNYCIFCIIF